MPCLYALRNATHFLRSNLRHQHQLIKKICLPTDQYTRTLSNSSNLKSCMKFTPLESNPLVRRSSVHLSKISKLLPGSTELLQCRMSSSSTDHVRLWQIERIASAALPVLLPASLILENPIVDSLLAVIVVMHTHWGLEAIIVDYARPIVVGSLVPKVLHLLLSLLSVVTLAGLLVLIYNGPGIAKTMKNVWEIGKDESVPHDK